MNRKALADLKMWFHEKTRKPLVLRGARQVGKSTLVKLLAQNLNLHLIEVDLEIHSFTSLKADDLNVEDFILEIENKLKTEITPNSLLFLDEIQKSPKAFMLLRYFYEKLPHIPVIAAGSLLEFIFDEKNISIPVGRIEYYYLGPMSFFEFLEAMGETQLIRQIENNSYKLKSIHFELIQKRLQEYLFVGGMPEAVLTFSKTKNFNKTRRVHNSIIETYRDDFPKYTKSSQYEKINLVFAKIHHFVGKKIKYSEISKDYQSKEIKHCIKLLEKAKIIIKCFHSNGTDISLAGTEDLSVYKIYYLDIGLLNSIFKIPWEELIQLENSQSSAKGFIYEQFIAQHLFYINGGFESTSLYYWLRDKKSNLAEVDFLIQNKNEIFPLEVKSLPTSKLKSLKQFMGEVGKNTALRFQTTNSSITEPIHLVDGFYFKGSQKLNVKFKLLNFHLSQIENLLKLL